MQRNLHRGKFSKKSSGHYNKCVKLFSSLVSLNSRLLVYKTLVYKTQLVSGNLSLIVSGFASFNFWLSSIEVNV